MGERLKQVVSAAGSDGLRYRVELWVEVLDAATGDDPDATAEGMKTLKVNGRQANRVGKGRYQLDTGFQTIDLTSDDPDAP